MNDRLIDLVNRDIDGLLSADERHELHQILASDPEARQFHESHAYAAGLLKKSPTAAPPSDLKSNIMSSVRKIAASSASKPRERKWVTFLAGLFQPSGAIPLAMGMAAGIVLTVIFWGNGHLSDMDSRGMGGTLVDWSAHGDADGYVPVKVAVDEDNIDVRYVASENSATIYIDAEFDGEATIAVHSTAAALAVGQKEAGGAIRAEVGDVEINHVGTNSYAIVVDRASNSSLPVVVSLGVKGKSASHSMNIEWR